MVASAKSGNSRAGGASATPGGRAPKKALSKSSNLRQAKAAKMDEFYTRMSDIVEEVGNYKNHFKNKVVYCNCDDPRVSHFFRYFAYAFEQLKLKKLIATCYKNKNPDLFTQNESAEAVGIEYKIDKHNKNSVPYDEYMKKVFSKTYPNNRDEDNVLNLKEIGIKRLESDGDFRNAECVALLKQADIVVTNPPFSLFREYVAQLVEHKKQFIIIGSYNAISYKEIFKLIKENKMWLGYGFNGGNAFFKTAYAKEFAKGVYDEKTGLVKFRNVTWFTNLDISKRHEDLPMYATYKGSEKDYPKYDNFDAINVNKTKDIPYDYKGAMGVPVTFLDKHNPDQFEILGNMSTTKVDEYNFGYPYINGKKVYARLIIKHKNPRKGIKI